MLLFALIAIISCKKTTITEGSDPDRLHNQAVGTSAADLLNSGQYKSLKIELQYMKGFAPDEAAIHHFKNFVTAYVNKPAGVTIVTKEISSLVSSVMSIDEIIEVERKNRSQFSAGEELAVYILYTNGSYTNDKTLGIAYRNTSAVLFGQKIRNLSGGLGQPSRTHLEAVVLEHEMGHLLGLVDLGTPMQAPHKDASHSGHCDNRKCLMYFSAETTDVLGFLATGTIPSLDAACVNDLKAGANK